MVVGVSEGYKKTLELVGVGFRASSNGQVLELSLGYTHAIYLGLAPEIKVQAMDLSTGKVKELSAIPNEVKKKVLATLAGSIGELGEDEGEKKKEAEAEPATV